MELDEVSAIGDSIGMQRKAIAVVVPLEIETADR
jgi:hypothetical protein